MVAVDAVSLVVEALSAGAAAGAQESVTQAVKDAYGALRDSVRRRLIGRAAGETALEQHARRPEQWTGALEAELVDAGVDASDPLVEVAQRLMALLDSAGSQSGKYLVDVRGAQGVQVGDHNTQNVTFGTGPSSID